MTDTSSATGKLLSSSDRQLCISIADQNIAPFAKRAQALLCLDEGMTQRKACEITELSLGQLRYALSLFKKDGMSMFPEQQPFADIITPEPKEETVTEEPESVTPQETEITTEPEQDAAPEVPQKKYSLEEMSASITELLEEVEAELPVEEKKVEKKVKADKGSKKSKKKTKTPKKKVKEPTETKKEKKKKEKGEKGSKKSKKSAEKVSKKKTKEPVETKKEKKKKKLKK